MNIFAALDNYCERVDPSFWAEPFNAISNLSPLIAGLILLSKVAINRKQLEHQNYFFCLAMMPVLISVGSFLFHTFGTVWGYWADVLPIIIFQLMAIGFICQKLLKFSRSITFFALVVFLMTTSALTNSSFIHLASGSLPYTPSLLFLIIFYIKSKKTQNKDLIKHSLYSILLLLSALVFRSLDGPLCSDIPIGTHFLWHILAGLLFYQCCCYTLAVEQLKN